MQVRPTNEIKVDTASHPQTTLTGPPYGTAYTNEDAILWVGLVS
jgi:hypothetical protein